MKQTTQRAITRAKELSYLGCPDKIIAMVRYEMEHEPPRRAVERILKERESVRGLHFFSGDVDPNDDGSHYEVPRLYRPAVRTYTSSPQRRYQPAYIEPPRNKAPKAPPIGAREIMKAVADMFGISYDDLLSRKRSVKYVAARAVAAKIMRDRNPYVYSYAQIGRVMGERDHTTILNLLSCYEQREKRFPAMREVRLALTNAD